MRRFNWRRSLLACALPAALAGCAGDLANTVPPKDVVDRFAVVVNRDSRSLNLIPFNDEIDPARLNLSGMGAPVGLAVQGTRALVPTRNHVVAVANLEERYVERVFSVGLTDVVAAAFVSDTVAVAATSSPTGALLAFDPRTAIGITVPDEAGLSPIALVPGQGRMYVLNARSAPDSANGAVTVLDALTLRSLGVVKLRGVKPVAMTMYGPLLYVLNAGSDSVPSSVSVVDPSLLSETAVISGFGPSPSSLAVNGRGDIYVSIPGKGVVIYSTLSRTFLRGPENPLTDDGLTDVASLAADPAGFAYAVQAGGCVREGTLMRLDTAGKVVAKATTGFCPLDVKFTSLTRR